jgi:hypothetical protein
MHVPTAPQRRRGLARLAGVLASVAVLVVAIAAVAGAQDTPAESPVIDGYAPTPVAVVLPTRVESPPPPTQEVAKERTQRTEAVPAEVERKTLPFTGLQLVVMLIGGAGLVGLGLALRAVRPPATA